jgi:hypothetical protein
VQQLHSSRFFGGSGLDRRQIVQTYFENTPSSKMLSD